LAKNTSAVADAVMNMSETKAAAMTGASTPSFSRKAMPSRARSVEWLLRRAPRRARSACAASATARKLAALNSTAMRVAAAVATPAAPFPRCPGRAAPSRPRGRGALTPHMRRNEAPLTSMTVPLAISASGEAR
jgi:hypothetical protein